MCVELCELSETGEMQSCQDCGALICFDTENGDDIIRPAFVTSSGDLFCDRCGIAHERREEAADDFDDMDFFDPLDLADELDDLPILSFEDEPTPEEQEAFDLIWPPIDIGGEG